MITGYLRDVLHIYALMAAVFLSALVGGNSLSYAIDLSDIKLEELNKPAEAAWGRDPFVRYEDRYKRPVLEEEPKLPPEAKIDGIISDGTKYLVIINGGFYRAGDFIYDFKIDKITDSRVELKKGKTRLYLGIDKFAIERTPKGTK